MALVGRLSERQALEKLLDAATAGLSGVLVLRGEAGFGKTALLDAAAEAAAVRSIQIARLTGVESETQLSYAGLHRLLLRRADLGGEGTRPGRAGAARPEREQRAAQDPQGQLPGRPWVEPMRQCHSQSAPSPFSRL